MADAGFTSTDPLVQAKIKAMLSGTSTPETDAAWKVSQNLRQANIERSKGMESYVGVHGARNTALNYNPVNRGQNSYQMPTENSSYLDGGNRSTTDTNSINSIRASYGLPPLSTGLSIYASSPASSAVSSTNGIRSFVNGVKETGNAIIGSIDSANTYAGPGSEDFMNSVSFGDSAQGSQMQQQINELSSRIASGMLTPSQEAQVQAQVDQISENYNRLIEKAKRDKELGMGRALVGAGERGGLMNTQYAGVAALLPTAGGDFVGAGGELSRVKSEYDANISTLESQRLEAMAGARAAAMEAIATGNSQALEAAYKAFSTAQSLYQEKNALIEKKMTYVQSYQDKAAAAQRVTRESAQDTLTAIKDAGLTADDLPAGFFEDLDKQLGYPSGTSAKMLKEDTSGQQKEAITAITSLKNAGLFGTMKDVEIQELAAKIGADAAALIKLRDDANAPNAIPWELTTDPDGNLIAAKFDPETGAYESTLLQKKTVRYGGGGGGSDSDESQIQAFEKAAAKYIEDLDASEASDRHIKWGTAWDALHAQFPEAPNWLIDEKLGGGYDPERPDANEQGYWGRAK